MPGYIAAPDTALTYPWKRFIGDHGQTRDPRRLKVEQSATCSTGQHYTVANLVLRAKDFG
ncbi:MAG: hypothetical protein JWO02_1535 [Solirubrobacterales bacterium]|nr:hypothetical protein [Solirubrobacterales bacterium]